MRWLVRAARSLTRGELGWTDRVAMWPTALKELRVVFEWVCTGGAFEVWKADDVPVAYGASDAAGGAAGAQGYVWRVGERVVVVRRTGGGQHINDEESAALESGVYDVMAAVQQSGRVVWLGDNTAANGWAVRSWSPRWTRNGRIRVRVRIRF